MNRHDRDAADADLIQRTLLDKHEHSWVDDLLDIALWCLSFILILSIFLAPAIWDSLCTK